MYKANDKIILSLLWREFEKSEGLLRFTLLHSNRIDVTTLPLAPKKIRIEHQDSNQYEITCFNPAIRTFHSRIYNYARLILELKAAAGSLEGSMVFGGTRSFTISDAPKNPLLLIDDTNDNEGVIKELCDTEEKSINVDYEHVKKHHELLVELNEAYNRRILELEERQKK